MQSTRGEVVVPRASDVVVVRDLVKRYEGSRTAAVAGVNFRVRSGEVFGLLGPNGAGKSTTVGMLTTRVRPTSGVAFIGGVDVERHPKLARKVFASVSQRNNLDRSLNVRQNLVFHGAYHRLSRVERKRRANELMERFGLGGRAEARVDRMSGGQAQRVMIARAMMHDPAVVFLDEPSAGLDPQARRFVHEQINAMRDEGVVVVLTTHDMDEAAELCDRVTIVDHGEILACGPPDVLVESLPSKGAVTVTLNVRQQSGERVRQALAFVGRVSHVEWLDPEQGKSRDRDATAELSWTVRFRVWTTCDPSGLVPLLVRVFDGFGFGIGELAVGKPTLEDTFIHLTGRELR